jgi:acyl dehydratase
MQLSEVTPGVVVAVGGRTVSEQEIVEFESRFLGAASNNARDNASRKRKSHETTASVWMLCAIAQELASTSVLYEMWSIRPPLIERMSWCDSVRAGDEVRLQIEILEKRLSTSRTTGWVRWRWVLATQVTARALELIAGSLFEDRPRSERGLEALSANRVAYKVAEAAKVVGMSRYVLYNAIRSRELPAYRLPSRTLWVAVPAARGES